MENRVALIPAAGWLKGFETPRALVSLGRELMIERLLRQLGKLKVPALVAYGGEGWKPEHTDRLLGLDFPPLSFTFMPKAAGKRNSRATVAEMLEKVLDRADYWGLVPKSRIYVLFVDFVMAYSLLWELTRYSAPCVYSFKRGDLSIILTLSVVSAYLKLSEPYDSTAVCLRQERMALDELEFGWMKQARKELGQRFWEVDEPSDLARARELVLEWARS